MNKLWQQFRPAYLLTWPVFFTTYIWSLVVHFTDSILNTPGFLLKRLIIITGLQLLAFLMTYVIVKQVVDRTKSNLVPAVLFLTICVVSLFRGFVFEHWLNAWNITESFDLNVRMRASLVNLTVAFTLSTMAVANTRRYHMINSQLILERERLELTRSNAETAIAEIDKTLVASIQGELREYVKALENKSLNEVLPQLRNLIDQVVQPLSRRIQTQYTPWSPPIGQQKRLKVRWKDVLIQSFRPNQIKYLMIPFLMIMIAIPTANSQSSLPEVLRSMIAVFLAAAIVGKVFRIIFRNSKPNFFSYFLVVITTSLSMGVASLDLTKDYENRYALVAPAISLYIIAALITSVFSSRENLANQITSELSETVKEMQWSVSRVREGQRQRYQNLSRYLHGHLQAFLSSKYLELEKLDPSAPETNETLCRVIAEIYREIEEIDASEHLPEPVIVVIEKIAQSWEKVAKIEPVIESEVLNKVELDQLCRNALVDVLPELVFNGIKHGKATDFRIELNHLAESDVVRLVITDNGNFELVESVTGVGTRILNESCISWNRVRKDSKTVTTADFAFSQ